MSNASTVPLSYLVVPLFIRPPLALKFVPKDLQPVVPSVALATPSLGDLVRSSAYLARVSELRKTLGSNYVTDEQVAEANRYHHHVIAVQEGFGPNGSVPGFNNKAWESVLNTIHSNTSTLSSLISTTDVSLSNYAVEFEAKLAALSKATSDKLFDLAQIVTRHEQEVYNIKVVAVRANTWSSSEVSPHYRGGRSSVVSQASGASLEWDSTVASHSEIVWDVFPINGPKASSRDNVKDTQTKDTAILAAHQSTICATASQEYQQTRKNSGEYSARTPFGLPFKQQDGSTIFNRPKFN